MWKVIVVTECCDTTPYAVVYSVKLIRMFLVSEHLIFIRFIDWHKLNHVLRIAYCMNTINLLSYIFGLCHHLLFNEYLHDAIFSLYNSVYFTETCTAIIYLSFMVKNEFAFISIFFLINFGFCFKRKETTFRLL